MIEVKGSVKFFEYYEKKSINFFSEKYDVKEDIDIDEIIINAVRCNLTNPYLHVVNCSSRVVEDSTLYIRNGKTRPYTDSSEFKYSFNSYDDVIVLCDIDDKNRLIVNISTSY